MIRKSKSDIFYIFLSAIILNSCAVKNDLMAGSEIAEFALPLSFESQKRKIQKNPNNQLFYLNAAKTRVQFANGILIEKADRLMFEDYFKSREYYNESLELFMISRNYLLTALELRHDNFLEKMKNKEKIEFNEKDIDYLYWVTLACLN